MEDIFALLFATLTAFYLEIHVIIYLNNISNSSTTWCGAKFADFLYTLDRHLHNDPGARRSI